MQVVDLDRTLLGRAVALPETQARAEKAMPMMVQVVQEDRDEHLERIRAMRYVARYGRPYAPLIEKHRVGRK